MASGETETTTAAQIENHVQTPYIQVALLIVWQVVVTAAAVWVYTLPVNETVIIVLILGNVALLMYVPISLYFAFYR